MAYGEKLKKLNPCGAGLMLCVLNAFGTAPDMRVLDAGCGRGATLKYLSEHSGYRLAGLELDSEYAACAGRQGSIDVVCGDILSMPFEDSSFDSVIMECVFSLLSDPRRAADEAGRVIPSGGTVVLSDMISRAETDGALDSSELVRRLYRTGTITGHFAQAGFDLVYFEDRTKDLQRMLAQMILDGTACETFSENDRQTLRRYRTGYGMFVFEKQ